MGTVEVSKISLFNRTSLTLSFAVLGILLGLGCCVPILAARDYLKPTSMIFARVAMYCAFGSGGVFGLGMALVYKRTRLKYAFLCVLGSSVACLLIYRSIMTEERSSALFLREFSKRIDREVGAEALNALFLKVQGDVEKGVRLGNALRGNELPKSLEQLFRTTALNGSVNYIEKDIYDVRITWGGPLFRWGVGLSAKGFEHRVESGAARFQRVYTNVIVFIE